MLFQVARVHVCRRLSCWDRASALQKCFISYDAHHLCFHLSLQLFDSSLRSALQRICNSGFSDSQWLQASLSVRDGGLRVRRVSSLALPAYLASAASTLSLQNEILSGCAGSEDTFFQTYLLSWSDSFGDVPESLPAKQSIWDRPGIAADRALVESNLSTSFQLASFRAASSPHSGDWLFALPISPCGLCLDDEAVRIAVSVRLGMAICVPHNCHCGSLVDAHGLHSFVCRKA